MKNLVNAKRNAKFLFPVIFFSFTLLLLNSCSKDEEPDNGGTLGAISWPQKWVFATDYDESTYKYVYNNGSAIYRGSVEKTYSINDLIEEKDCQFEVNPAGYGGTDKIYTIRSAQNPDYWWGVFSAYTPFGVEQWYLGTTEDDELPTGDECRFILHSMPKVDGKSTFVIESYKKRGQYLDNVGHNFSGNGLSFIAYDKPENAPHFKVLLPAGTSIGN